jgi:H+-transporting ATPase
MIVMIALLNDGAILSIAYDNVHYRNKPEAWNMRLVLAISTVLGVIGVVAAFGLFYLAERVFHFDRLHAQTLMYLKLSVAGHLTIFLTRTRGPFWSIRPAKILWMAVLGTQTIATLIAVYGLFMTPLGWKWAGFVWGYAIAWALINDRIKLLAYKIFDPVKAAPKADTKGESKPDAKTEPKPDVKADQPKPEAKTDAPAPEAKPDQPKPEAKAEPKPDAKPDAPAPEAKAETKPDAKAEPKSETKTDEPKPEAKADVPKPDAKADQPKPDAKLDAPTPEAKAEPKHDAKTEPKPETKTEPNSDAKTDAPKPDAKTPSDLTPQVAKRAYEIYEKRAGNDGTAVQDWKKAEQEIRNDDAKAEPKPEAEADAPAPDAKAEPKPDSKAEPKPDTKADAPAPEAKADEQKPEAKGKPQPDVSPQLVKRVHEVYEQLGREDVQIVQNFEKAEPDLKNNESKK